MQENEIVAEAVVLSLAMGITLLVLLQVSWFNIRIRRIELRYRLRHLLDDLDTPVVRGRVDPKNPAYRFMREIVAGLLQNGERSDFPNPVLALSRLAARIRRDEAAFWNGLNESPDLVRFGPEFWSRLVAALCEGSFRVRLILSRAFDFVERRHEASRKQGEYVPELYTLQARWVVSRMKSIEERCREQALRAS